MIDPIKAMAEKPKYGDPCNRCGLCCWVTQCDLSVSVFGERVGPCPALESSKDGRTDCGIVANPQNYVPVRFLTAHGADTLSRSAALLIGAGDGCDARFNGGEERNPVVWARWEAAGKTTKNAIANARRLWRL